jgi:hypothetical protein
VKEPITLQAIRGKVKNVPITLQAIRHKVQKEVSNQHLELPWKFHDRQNESLMSRLWITTHELLVT